MKQHVIIFWLFISFTSLAQQENVFHNREFWKGQPNLETVKQKITEGNDPTAFNTNAFDATVYAILEKADVAVATYLLSLEGNPVNKRTHDSRIYLHWAAFAGHIDIVNYLLNKGSNMAALDSHGNTPLTFAAGAGQIDQQLFEAFENHGLNLIEEKNEAGANLLLIAAPSLSTADDLAQFTSKGFDINSHDADGNGIFNYASKKGRIDFLKLLVKKGVDYKSLNKEGGNAFMFATQGGRGYSNPLSLYQYLKSLELDPNSVTKEGSTPLHRLAYTNKDPEIFEFFLAAGADVNQKDAHGNTPFLNAAARNDLDMVKLLSKHVNDFNATNNEGQTALMLAVQRNSPEVVKFLTEQNGSAFKPSTQDANGNDMAYYLVASFSPRNTEAFDKKLELLQAQGLQLNTIQAEGNTLYHLAAKNNDLSLLKRLVSSGIDVNAKNDEGLTALHLAAMKAENDQMMKYLISKGADLNIKTDFDESVYDLAIENEQLQKQHTSLNFLK